MTMPDSIENQKGLELAGVPLETFFYGLNKSILISVHPEILYFVTNPLATGCTQNIEISGLFFHKLEACVTFPDGNE